MKVPNGLVSFFQKRLLEWHQDGNNRSLPWKNEKDPYKIWLSEVILQQTRAEQGTPYYLKFISHYPTIRHLALANDDDVFKLWQGLGYYNRCKNMIATARYVHQELNDTFPNTYIDILALKGVGSYTAAAIASFAYALPYAVVDGNVYRVLARYLGIDVAIDTTEGKNLFKQLAQDFLIKENPGTYNQAIMDFGAVVCKPQKPDCNACTLSTKCVANRQQLANVLPVKSKKLQVKTRHFQYLVFLFKQEIYVQQRTEKDVWQNLYEFFLVEDAENIQEQTIFEKITPIAKSWELNVFKTKQRLTHQLIVSDFHVFHLKEKPDFLPINNWRQQENLKNIAFPLTIFSFFNKKKYF